MLVWATGCLSDRALRIECGADDDCEAGERCTYGVCVSNARFPVPCTGGLTACDGGCVDLRRSADHCGDCFEACRPGPSESAVCVGGECSRTCAAGHVDVDPEVPGCEYVCTRTSPSVEVCDGLDNDCDGRTDGADDSLLAPACDVQDGVCEGARRPCGDGAATSCSADDYALHAGVAWEAEELRCDGLDNDCDGRTDERCCTGVETPFEVVADGSWSVLGFPITPDGPQLLAYDADTDAIVVLDVTTPGDPLRLDEIDVALCEGIVPFHADYVSLRRSVLTVCDNVRGWIELAEVGTERVVELVELAEGERVLVFAADADDEAIVFAARLRRDVGPEGTLLGRVGAHGPADTAEFLPPTDIHGGASIAAAPGGAVVSFATRNPDEVRLQPVGADLAPDGFAELVAAPPDWPEAMPLATAVARTADGGHLVAHPGAGGGLSLTLVDGNGGAMTTPLTTMPAIAVRVRKLPSGGFVVGAVAEDGVRGWTVDRAGAVLETWDLPITGVARDAVGIVPARPVLAPTSRVLTVAYGSPFDAAQSSLGLVVHRLGVDSAPLCH